jgi:hypothetical protein
MSPIVPIARRRRASRGSFSRVSNLTSTGKYEQASGQYYSRVVFLIAESSHSKTRFSRTSPVGTQGSSYHSDAAWQAFCGFRAYSSEILNPFSSSKQEMNIKVYQRRLGLQELQHFLRHALCRGWVLSRDQVPIPYHLCTP